MIVDLSRTRREIEAEERRANPLYVMEVTGKGRRNWSLKIIDTSAGISEITWYNGNKRRKL